MADPITALDVPGVPGVAVSTAVIAEVPVSVAGTLTVPPVPSTAVSGMPDVYASATILNTRVFLKGMLKISPLVVGRVSINDNSPAYWFPWGKNIVIEPTPDDQAEYQLLLHVADYPRRDLNHYHNSPDELPEEFHPCIVDFCLYTLSVRLKKWGQAVRYYNAYVRNLKMRRQEYIKRKAEQRAICQIPANVKYGGGQPWAH